MWEEPAGVGLGPWLWRVEMRVGPLEPASPTRPGLQQLLGVSVQWGWGSACSGVPSRAPACMGVHEPGGGRSRSPLNEQLPPGP